jgi:hypothetical protein
MTMHPENSCDYALQLLALTQRLCERLLAQTQNLANRKPHLMAAHIEDTRNLSNLYRFETTRVQKDPALLTGLSDDYKSALREATLSLQALVQSHALALDATKTITEGLICAIAREAAQQDQRHATYGPQATARAQVQQSLNINYRA